MRRKTKRFGKYRLIERIGVGGMAEVYKAQYLQDKESPPIAIKRILADLSRDKKLIAMLINEAKLAMTLKHPNIVPIYDFGLVDGHYFIAMEYIEGTDVRSLLKKAYADNEKIPLDAVFHIMASLLEGLFYAHTKRDNFNKPLEIIHRDVSPQNIMLANNGEVKILDFGIAKAKGSHFEMAKANGSLTETQAGILKGKFSYMSPEQAKGKPLDQRSDIFSAGIVLWELLTVQSLFGGSTEIKIIEKVRKAKIPDPSQKNPDVTKELTKIVRKALSRSRWKRFQTAEEFKNQLLLLAYKNGLIVNKDFMSDYISKQFPKRSEPQTVTVEISGSVVQDKDSESISKISEAIASEIGEDTEGETISEITDAPSSLNASKETHMEPLSSLPSLQRSYVEEPSYTLKAKVRKIFNLRTAAILTGAGILILLLINLRNIKLNRETAKTIYKYTVLIPREKVRELAEKGEERKPVLPFDPSEVIKTGNSIFFSSPAKKYIYSLSMKRYDNLRDALDTLFEPAPTEPQRCAGSKNISCAVIDGHKVFYIPDRPAGTITVSKIVPLKR